VDVHIAEVNGNMDPIGTAKVIYQKRRNSMPYPKHQHLEKVSELEKYLQKTNN
tara:strand:- start:34 stop:192 length:159 start_codon:yes stop_codon:yes gene_type:complete